MRFFQLGATALCCLTAFNPLSGQTILVNAESELKIWARQMLTDSIDGQRETAADSLFVGMQRALAMPGSFDYPFDSLPQISFKTPPDRKFRIITWQLMQNDSTWQHFGFLQVQQPKPALYVLHDQRAELPYKPVREQLSPEHWYGALYYNLYQFDATQGRRYLLFGFDGFSLSERRKLIEVLWFDPKTGEPRFGDTVFDRGKDVDAEPELRILLEYYAEGVVRLNWDESYKMILFDHLIPMSSPYNGQMTYVPDGSYQGFRLEKGRWIFIDRVFTDVQEEAPRPFPVLDKEQNKDIMGRERKKKN
ncbi:MAG: hypothetical protein ACOYNO_00885 [Saprospiraceae bacterium]